MKRIRAWHIWGLGMIAVATVAYAQSFDIQYPQGIRYVVSVGTPAEVLTNFGPGQFPGQFVVAINDSQDVAAFIWNQNDGEWEAISGDAANVIINGQLSLARGTANDPTIVFTGDDDGTGTGMYSSAADSLNVSINGSNSLLIASTGVSVSNGSAAAPGLNFFSSADMGLYRTAGNLNMAVAGALVFNLEDTNSAGAGADIATVSATMGIMNGSDTWNGLSVEPTSANHTGVGNVVRGGRIAAITGDAQSRETGLDVLGGYDVGISSIGAIFARQEFEEPMRVIPDDLDNLTIDLADADINLVSTANGIQFEYREELTKTASSMIFASGAIDISARTNETITPDAAEALTLLSTGLLLPLRSNTSPMILPASFDTTGFASTARMAPIDILLM